MMVYHLSIKNWKRGTKMRKVLSLLLALLLIASLLAGCAQDEPSEAEPSIKPTAQETAKPSESKEPEAPKAVAEGGQLKLPLVESTTTFTAWNSWDVSTSGITDNNESYAYQKLEELTNVHIQWFHPAAAQAGENFNLSIASGDYYDTYMCSIGNLLGGPDYYIENEIFIDLTPYMAAVIPNYKYVCNIDAGTLPTTITDSGYVVGFWQLAKTLQWPWLGPLGRTDWLTEMNMAIPETYDELYDVLVAFRDVKNAEFPLSLTSSGLDGWLMAGFDTMYVPSMGQFFIQVDGQVRFGATEPGFKDFILLMKDWYSQGLIDKDFYTKTDFLQQPASNVGDITQGKVGVGRSLYTFPDFMERMALAAGIEGLEWCGFYQPVKNKGDKIRVSMESTATNFYKGGLGTISTQCEDIETLLRWYDYFYTEEGSILANYGIENQGFTYVDGRPKSTELVYADAEGRAMNSMFPLYAMAQSQPMWYDWERELSPETTDKVLDTKDRFMKNWVGDWTLPTVSPTNEESAEYSSIMGDINTLISENVVKFITGSRPISEFDAFIDQIISLNIARAVEIQQDALDRYNARVG